MNDLLINGPVESIGISGQEAHIEKKLFPKNCIKNFNTIENVAFIASSYQHLFKRIIWNVTDRDVDSLDDIYEELKKNSVNNIELVCRTEVSDDVIHHPRWGAHPLSENNTVKYIKNLIHLLNVSDSENIVIIRSDQFINLNLLNFNIDSRYIYVPRLKKSYIEAGDTYIVSCRKLLLNKLNFAQDNKRGLDNNIHRIFWKAQAYADRHKYRIPLIYFKLMYPYNVGVWSKKIAEYIQSSYLRPMSFEIYKTIEWRGSNYSNKHLEDMKRNYFFK